MLSCCVFEKRKFSLIRNFCSNVLYKNLLSSSENLPRLSTKELEIKMKKLSTKIVKYRKDIENDLENGVNAKKETPCPIQIKKARSKLNKHIDSYKKLSQSRNSSLNFKDDNNTILTRFYRDKMLTDDLEKNNYSITTFSKYNKINNSKNLNHAYKSPFSNQEIQVNSLAKKCPEIAAQQHSELNSNLPFTPETVHYLGSQRVYWKCSKGPDHVQMSTIKLRTRKPTQNKKRTVKRNNPKKHEQKCPFCLNLRLSVTNSLAFARPYEAKLQHPTLNGKLTPSDVIYNSKHLVQWIGENNKPIREPINLRTTRFQFLCLVAEIEYFIKLNL